MDNIILFRFHTSTLKDSIKTIFEVKNKKELIRHLQIEFDFYNLNEDDIVISFYGIDDRLENWKDTYIVEWKNGGVIGFTNSHFKNKENKND